MTLKRYTPAPGPEKVGDILGRMFTARGWGRRQGRLQLEAAWAEVAGPDHAAQSRVGAFRRGVLEIVVSNGVMLQEFAHFHKRRLLEQLRRRLPNTTLTDLRFAPASSRADRRNATPGSLGRD